MAKPVASYNPLYPNAKDPLNTQQERTTATNQLIARAADYNQHDEMLRALECYLGIHPVSWQTGDDTVNDRLVRIGGTAGCWEAGTICGYDTIDPSGWYIDKTGFIGTWIDPTGVPGVGPAAPNGPQPTGIAWPGPGGPPPNGVQPNPPLPGNPNPGNPGNPPGDVNPYNPPPFPGGPFGPAAPGGGQRPWNPPFNPGGAPLRPLEWTTQDYLRFLNWKVDTNMLRHEWANASNINFWDRNYASLFPSVTDTIELIDGWPNARPLPSVEGQATMFDWMLPANGLVQQMSRAMGIQWFPGTIQAGGLEIDFDTSSTPINGGNGSTPASSVVFLLAPTAHATTSSTNIADMRTEPGDVSIITGGMATGGAHNILLTTAIPFPLRGMTILVGVFTSRLQISVQGDNTTRVVENLIDGGGGVFTPTFIATDGVNNEPAATLVVLSGGLAAGTPLQYNGGSLGTGEWQISGSTYITFGADSITLVQHSGLADADAIT